MEGSIDLAVQHIENHLAQIREAIPYSYWGGGRFAPTITYLRIRVCVCVYTCQFFVTFPHFECGRGYNRFDTKKSHRFLRNYKSWSDLLRFHKGGPLRTS